MVSLCRHTQPLLHTGIMFLVNVLHVRMNHAINDPLGSPRAPSAVLASGLRRTMRAVCLALALLPGPASPRAWAAASVDDLTGPWQLLVDDFPVAAKTNVARTYHPLRKYAGNPVLVADQPWEQSMVYLYGTVLHDESGTGYRMWYHTLRTNKDICTSWDVSLYAISTNGINWDKPALNLRSTCGSASNNMYYTRSSGGGLTSVIHTPWEADPAQRYKLMSQGTGGYWGAWSSNGVNVVDATNNPVLTGGSDVGQFCWDPHTQRYLGYVKNAWYDWNGLKRRAVALTTATNITNWPQESLILWPDAFDDRWSTNSIQRTHFYGLSAFPYESMYLGFLWIFQATNMAQGNPGYVIGPIFDELVSSHDGVNWTREEGERPPILPLGTNGTWDSGMVFTARAPVVDGDTLKVWYSGFDQMHDYDYSITHAAIGLATLRKDGFASLNAGATAGTIMTKPLTGSGGALQVNYQASVGGSLKVEVLDVNSNVLSGYSQADCVALTGDSVSQAVAWAAHAQLPTSPSAIRLRFVLQKASLYSFMAGDSALIGVPPAIMLRPRNQTVPWGGYTNFAVVAAGSNPFFYQWQKDSANLSDGGHYAGCTTPTLTITNADDNAAAGYRCVVTNAYGSVTSSPATLMVATNAFGSVTLTNISVAAGYTANEARAITPDGKYVVGFHGSYSTAGSGGYLYDVANNALHNLITTPDSAQAAALTGVGYRTYNGQTQLVLDGWSSGWHANFMTANSGTTWGLKRQDVNWGNPPGGPAANSMAGTATDVFYATFRWNATKPGNPVYVGKLFGAWPMSANAGTVSWDEKGLPTGIYCGMNSVSATGRTVGYRTDSNGVRLNYALQWNGSGSPNNWHFNGLDGTTKGEALSISANGTIVFGRSPKPGSGTTNYGYKAVLTATVPGTVVSLFVLPGFPDTMGATNLAAPYGCTPDGKYAVGMCCRSAEKAVLWDTSDPNPARWTVLDLTDLAAASGTLDIFTRLTYAYSLGTNAAGDFVIVGVGTAGADTRAFVMTVSPPLGPLAYPPAVRISGSLAAGFTFSCLSLANVTATYYLDCATNLPPLSGWTTIASRPGTGGWLNLSDPNPAGSQRFYRMRMQ